MQRLRIRELAWSPDGQRPLLDGIDLEVGDGELLGLIGPNGSGKTSLLRCAYRFQRPSVGSVELDGEALWQRSPRWSAQRVAVVLQEFRRTSACVWRRWRPWGARRTRACSMATMPRIAV